MDGVIAFQQYSGANQEVRWEHTDPSNASYIQTGSNGAMYSLKFQAELDPLGSSIGLSNLYNRKVKPIQCRRTTFNKCLEAADTAIRVTRPADTNVGWMASIYRAPPSMLSELESLCLLEITSNLIYLGCWETDNREGARNGVKDVRRDNQESVKSLCK